MRTRILGISSSGSPRQPEDGLVLSQLEVFFVAAQVSSPGLFGGLEGSTDLKVGTLSRGHLGQSPSHRKEAKKFLRAEYLDSAANYQIFTHFIIRVPQEHLTWGNCAIPRGCDQRDPGS